MTRLVKENKQKKLNPSQERIQKRVGCRETTYRGIYITSIRQATGMGFNRMVRQEYYTFKHFF